MEPACAAGLNASACAGAEDALVKALAGEGEAPHVVIRGSLHFVGDVLAMSPETWPT
jgi:dihydrofolate synthase / folylpolyglutamate synthase